MFPLGDSTKDEVRAEAAARGLAVADKPDSHDICFIADGDTRGFLAAQLGARQGPIVDAETGEVLGTHDGSFGFTVGQRRGLNLGRPGAGRRAALRAVDPPRRQHRGRRCPASGWPPTSSRPPHPVWTAGARPATPFDCMVQLRAHGMTAPAHGATSTAGVVTARRSTASQRGVAAGQALVMYDGDAVLGSATITAAHRRVTAGMTERPWAPGAVTGIGSLPGTDPAEAAALVLGELPDLPHLPELPARGPGADMVGRGAALLVDLPVELVPSGWRLTARPGPRPAPRA